VALLFEISPDSIPLGEFSARNRSLSPFKRTTLRERKV